MSERDEKNRKIAEFLGWRTETAYSDGRDVGLTIWLPPAGSPGWQTSPPDFYGDEAANALLLEAMPEVTLHHSPNGTWSCWYRRSSALCDADRKTVVCEAFIVSRKNS